MKRLSIATGAVAPLARAPLPSELAVPLSGHAVVAACGARVGKGGKLAVSGSPDVGDVHAPAAGIVTAVEDDLVVITVDVADAGAEGASPVDLARLSGEELLAALKGLGLPVERLAPGRELVLNGLNPEPGVSVAGQLLAHHADTLAAGLELAMRAVSPRAAHLVVEQGRDFALPGPRRVAVDPVYPNGLDELAVKAATGFELPRGLSDDVRCVPVGLLFLLGRVAETGLPVTEVPVSVGRGGFLAAPGTPASSLAALAGETLGAGDRALFGGGLRGRAAAHAAEGLPPDAYAFTRVPAGAYAPVKDTECVGCGSCIRICPSRIDPCMISGYAEFGMWDKAGRAFADACMECGLCGYVCLARRPLLQYIRLAKAELASLCLAATAARAAEAALADPAAGHAAQGS